MQIILRYSDYFQTKRAKQNEMKLRSQSKKITTLDKGSIKRDKNKAVEIGVKLKHSVSSTKNASMAGRVVRVRLPTCFPDDPASHSFGATENTDEKGEKVKSESRNPRLQTSFQVEKKKDEYCSLKVSYGVILVWHGCKYTMLHILGTVSSLVVSKDLISQ